MYDNALPLVRCSLCDLGYAPSDAGDRRWHATYHGQVDKLAAHLGRWPAGYSERERQHEAGRPLLQHGATLDQELRGADLVLSALYDREVLQGLHRDRSGRTLDLVASVGQELPSRCGGSTGSARNAGPRNARSPTRGRNHR